MASWQDAPPVDQEAQQQPTWMSAPPAEQEQQKPTWMAAPPVEESAWNKAPPVQQDKPGFFSPVLPTFSGKDWLGAGEAAINMIGSMPGIGAGAAASAATIAGNVPTTVGLPGIAGASLENVGPAYHAAEDWVNNKLGGVGAQYKPGTPEGKAFVAELAKSIEAAMGHVDSWIRTGGKFVGAPEQVTDLVATTAKIGEEYLLTVGPAGLGAKGVKAVVRPGEKLYLPNEKGGVVSNVNAALDKLDALAETQKRTQGEGTIHVGTDGTATVGEMPKIQETGEQLDLYRTAQQNELQKKAVGEQGEPTDLFPAEKGKAHEQQAQALDVLADQAEKAGNEELAAKYRTQAEQERSSANSYVDTTRQGNLDLETMPMAKEAGAEMEPKGAIDPATKHIVLNNPEKFYQVATQWIKDKIQSEWDKKGTRFTDSSENVDRMLEDPWAWIDMFPKEFKEKFGVDYRELGGRGDRLTIGEDARARLNEPEDITLQHEQFVPPQDLPKYRQVLDFISTLFTGKAFNLRKTTEQWRRTDLFTDNNRNPIKLPDSIIQADGTIALADLIRAITERPELKDVRADLREVLEGLAPFLYDLQIRHSGETYATHVTSSGKVSTANAFYHPDTHMVDFGWQGFTAKTAIHELVHAATSRLIDRWMDYWTPVKEGELKKLLPSAPQALKDLEAIFYAVRARSDKVTLIDANGKNFTSQHIDGGAIYGLTDLHEFASEVMSNRFLRRIMAEMNDKKVAPGRTGPNLLAKFMDGIKKALGLSEDNLIVKAVTAIEDVMQIQKATMPEITAWMKSYYNNPHEIRNLITEVGGEPKASNDFGGLKAPTPETVAADKMSEVAGMHYIPKTPEITPELVAKIAAERDSTGSSTKKNLTPGMLSAAHLTGSTMFKTIYELMNAAYKRAEFNIHAHIKPVQEAFIGIMKNPEIATLSHAILMREMRNGKEYGAEELRAAGVPDKVIMAHLQFRNMMDRALESQNAQLRAKGLPEIKAIDAYISSRWSGPWRANIRDVDGNIVFQVAEHSRRGAEAAIEHLKQKNPDLKFEDVEYRHGHEKGADIDSGYLDMLKMLDPKDPRIDALKSAYEEYLTGRTVDVSSQEKHFQAKKGVGGFAGDRPWSKTDVQDFFVQQFAYAENAFRWAEHQKSMEGVNKLLNDPSLAESQKNNIQQSREYVKSQLGFGTSKLFDALDNAIAKGLGVSPAALQTYMGASKTLFYLSKLGLSIPFTVIQFIQPAITTPAFHAMLDSQGFKHNPVATTYKAITGGAQAALWHYGQYFRVPELTKLADSMMSDLDKSAARYMEANGIIDINPMTDIKKGLRPKALSAIAAPFEFTIKHSEVIARSMAFMGFVDHLKQSGKFDLKSERGRLELFSKAEDMTNLSMTDYRSQERAQIFEKGGLTGDAAATLHAYQLNNLMQVVSFTKMAKQGNVKPLFYMIAMQGLAAGLTGAWFIDDIDDMLNNLKKILPHDQYMQVKDFSLKNFIVDNVKTAVKSSAQNVLNPEHQAKLADAINYGVMSAITGTNIHTRASAANQIPVWPFESQEDPIKNAAGLVPFAETTIDTGMGIAAAVNPNNTNSERLAGAYKAAPAVAQGPMENLPGFSKNGVSLRTKDLSEGKYRRTEAEQSLRNFGLRSTAEQEHSTKEFQLSKVERELQRRVQNESAKAVDFFSDGNPKQGVEHAIRYIQLGGDPQTLVSGIPKAQLALATTELERRAIQAQGQSKASIMKLQRYLQQVGR